MTKPRFSKGRQSSRVKTIRKRIPRIRGTVLDEHRIERGPTGRHRSPVEGATTTVGSGPRLAR